MNKAKWVLRAYQWLTYLATPFLYMYLLKRKKQGKEDALRFDERFGKTHFPRPEGELLWVHAASVGESVSMLPLIQAICERFPDVNLMLTTGTTSSAAMIESRLPERAFHQYMPIDHAPSVKRFLRHWRPDLALWVESELWPNMIYETSKSCPMMLLNARVSDRSYRRWKQYSSLSSYILSHFVLALAQSRKDLNRLKELGAPNVKYVGNIKTDAPPLPSDPKKMGGLIQQTGDRRIWLAASTHPGEDDIIAEVHAALQTSFPDLLLILAPRHPKRAGDIEKIIKKQNLNFAKRSAGTTITEETDIYLADTVGELGLFYRLAPIVFIGGSLVEKGGQNPLEAARLDCAVIMGPHMDNFSEISHHILQADAALRVEDKQELQQAVSTILKDHDRQDLLAKNIENLVKEHDGVLEDFMTEIAPYIHDLDEIKHQKSNTTIADHHDGRHA